MEQDAYYFRVGLFVTLAFVAAFFVIGGFTRKHDEAGHIPYVIYFTNSVDGLNVGAPVKLRGIQVGYVESIQFAKDDTIRVVVEVLDGAPVRGSTTASLQLQGITGGSVIGLDNTATAKEPAVLKDKDGILIITSKPSSLERVFTSMPELIDQITKLVVQGQKMLNDDNVDAVHDSLASLSNSVSSLSKLIGGQNGQAIGGTLGQLNDMIGEAKVALREVRMLARTLREDPSLLIHGVKQGGVKVP